MTGEGAKRLRAAIRSLPLEEGGSGTGIPCVTAYLFTTGKITMPQTETPCLYIVLDGMCGFIHLPGSWTIWQASIPCQK